MAIKRVWHGWTSLENADKYQNILKEEVEFITIMTYESLQNVIGLQGEDYKKSYVPDVAQKVLKRWDLEATHYDLIDTRKY